MGPTADDRAVALEQFRDYLRLLARLQIESIEVEGPIQKEWPPLSHKTLFFAGDKRQDIAYAQEIFAKFLPRAYRRPVSKAEIAEIVAVVKRMLDGVRDGELAPAPAEPVAAARTGWL